MCTIFLLSYLFARRASVRSGFQMVGESERVIIAAVRVSGELMWQSQACNPPRIFGEEPASSMEATNSNGYDLFTCSVCFFFYTPWEEGLVWWWTCNANLLGAIAPLCNLTRGSRSPRRLINLTRGSQVRDSRKINTANYVLFYRPHRHPRGSLNFLIWCSSDLYFGHNLLV